MPTMVWVVLAVQLEMNVVKIASAGLSPSFIQQISEWDALLVRGHGLAAWLSYLGTSGDVAETYNSDICM